MCVCRSSLLPCVFFFFCFLFIRVSGFFFLFSLARRILEHHHPPLIIISLSLFVFFCKYFFSPLLKNFCTAAHKYTYTHIYIYAYASPPTYMFPLRISRVSVCLCMCVWSEGFSLPSLPVLFFLFSFAAIPSYTLRFSFYLLVFFFLSW